jgi:ribosomal protein S18 acetylase RimI-like enzyme
MADAAVRVRPAAATDVAAIVALARAVWQATYPAMISQAQIDHMLAERYAAARIQRELVDAAQVWRIAQAGDGTMLGFAHAILDGVAGKLDKLYVHPEHQRRGIGAALVEDIAVWARGQGAEKLWLQVNRGNAPALRAYEKYGFRIVRSQIFDIGSGFVMDDHVMERAL